MSGLKLQRIGQIMEPEPGNPMEVEGVFNPAVVRGPDGELYLFPRYVAKGNYSHIGIARVKFIIRMAIRKALNGLESHWSLNPNMNSDPMAAVEAKTHASLL